MEQRLISELDQETVVLFRALVANDQGHRLFDNAMLHRCLLAAAALHRLSADPSGMTAIGKWLEDNKSEPTNFLHLSAAVLLKLNKGAEMSDYDHFVQMAMAETLSDIMWPDKQDPELPGPGIADCLADYAYQEVPLIWQLLIRNYIGGLLQYVFETAKIRLEVRNLPPETESRLRDREAALIAQYVFRDLSLGSGSTAEVNYVINKLQQTMYLLIAE